MKRFLSCLLILALLLPLAAAACAEPAVTSITDAEGLLAIRSNPWGAYRIEADIDMSGVDWTPIPFKGQLDGGGHTLYNLTVTSAGSEVRTTRDGNLKAYDTVFAGLFSTLEYAEVSDLYLKGVLVDVETGTHCFAGGIAGYFDHSSITRCSVEGKVRMISTGVMVGVAGIVGYGCGSVTECSVDVELFFEDRNFSYRCEEFMGGVLACGLADVDRNTVAVRGYDSCHGYVHNGGLVGMYYHCGMSFDPQSMSNNYISGFISFFEDNPDRRAYCAATFGEHLQMPRRYTGNRDDFERRESWDYGTVLSPEKCAEPDYFDDVTEPGCDRWGFTHHVCKNCGYGWIDSYTPPRHTPGEWQVSVQPTVDREGQEQLRCAVCDQLLDERSVPKLIRVDSCRLDRRSVTLYYGETLRLTATVTPPDATGRALSWSSTDPSVAAVDESGQITAHGRGTALITVQTADGYGRDTCTVTVKYSLIQWLRNLFTGNP